MTPRSAPSARLFLDTSNRSVLLVPVLLLCSTAKAADPNRLNHLPDLVAFSRSALLERFDKDKNGKLDDQEKKVLLDAFGMAVPMLPASPYQYSRAQLPGHIEPAQLEQADNTPAANPLTDMGATLGRVLFYDQRLSRNDTVACASCHGQKHAFADPRRFSVGLRGERTKRNAMGLANLRYTHLKGRRPGFFWDERSPTLEAQVLMPIQDPTEMGMDLEQLERKLQKLSYYPPLFREAFGSPKVTSDRIAKAVAQFMRSMVSLDSKFDRVTEALAAGAAGSERFTAQENLGKTLFMKGVGGIPEFACAMCHVPPTFNMHRAHNIGLQLKYADKGLGALRRPSNHPFTPSNNGKFKAPSLRNIELTAPYMHDGRFRTLNEVVEHYSSGVHPHENLGLAFENKDGRNGESGLRFSDKEKAALVAFLKTLTGKKLVTDPMFSDPFIRAGK